MVIRTVLQQCIARLSNYGNTNPIFEANLIVRTALQLTPMDMVLQAKTEVSPTAYTQISAWTDRRCLGEPLQYILGTQEFMSLPFRVSPDVLVPRADTETLVETVLSKTAQKSVSILDIGTGTGCIAISLAYYKKNAFIRAVDISQKALDIAQYNAKLNGVNHRVRFERKNILTDTLHGKYDAVVSNPPYIETDTLSTLQAEVREHEPRHALDGGADGLVFYKRIIKSSPRLLNEHGLLAFEVGHTQAEAVAALMRTDFEQVEQIQDLCGVNRVVTGILRKGAFA